MTRLAAVPNSTHHHPVPYDANHNPAPPRLRLVPAPKMSQRDMVIESLIHCPDAPGKHDRS
jgi:hypothetical protein